MMDSGHAGSTRRGFLNLAVGAGLAAAMPGQLVASTGDTSGERTLRFYHTHTGELTRATYWADGRYLPDGLGVAAHILRDFRNGERKPIDPALLDMLVRLRGLLGADRSAFHIISGYRSPATNAMLAERSGGVARHSMHLEARAIDIRVPGVRLDHVRGAAMALQAGGVGYYPGSNFVHVDTGRVRTW